MNKEQNKYKIMNEVCFPTKRMQLLKKLLLRMQPTKKLKKYIIFDFEFEPSKETIRHVNFLNNSEMPKLKICYKKSYTIFILKKLILCTIYYIN